MTNNEIKKLIKEAKELRRMGEELASSLSDIEEKIKAELTERGTDTLIIDEYKVTWRAVTTARMDTAAIKKALPDVAERFSKPSTSKRFCIL